MKSRKWWYLGIVLVVYLSLIPRLITVVKGDYLFAFDQGRDYLAAKSIVVDHKQRLIGSELGGGFSGLGGIYQGPGYYYLLTIPFLLFHGDPYGGIVLMLVLSLASIGFSYFLGLKLLGKLGGMLLALLFAISPTFIQQSRYIWNTHPSTLFILLVLGSLYWYLKKGTLRLLFLTAFLCGFVYNFQTAVAIPLCLGLFVWLFIDREKRIKAYLLVVGGFILAYSPLLLFWKKHGLVDLHSVTSNSSLRFNWYETRYYLLDHLNSFFYSFLDTFPRPHIYFVVLFGLLLFTSVWFFLKGEQDSILNRFYRYLLLLIPTSFFVFAFFHNSVYVYYLMELNVVYIFLFAFVLVKAYFSRKLPWMISLGGVLVIFTLYAIYIGSTSFYRELREDPRKSLLFKSRVKAIDTIYRKAKGKPFGLLVFTPPIYTYEYDYIVWWYGKRTFGYLPSAKKEPLYYVLIQKDGSQPWTSDGWLATVVKPDRPLRFEPSDGGLIIGSE